MIRFDDKSFLDGEKVDWVGIDEEGNWESADRIKKHWKIKPKTMTPKEQLIHDICVFQERINFLYAHHPSAIDDIEKLKKRQLKAIDTYVSGISAVKTEVVKYIDPKSGKAIYVESPKTVEP